MNNRQYLIMNKQLHVYVLRKTFGQLENRWRILKCLNLEWGSDAATAIINCCMLHNMCKLFNYVDDIADNKDNIIDDSNHDDTFTAPSPTNIAKRQRDEIAQAMIA